MWLPRYQTHLASPAEFCHRQEVLQQLLHQLLLQQAAQACSCQLTSAHQMLLEAVISAEHLPARCLGI